MKPFHALIQNLERWRRKRHSEPDSSPERNHRNSELIGLKYSVTKGGEKLHSPIIFSLAVMALTSVVSYRFYRQPQLIVGSPSPDTILAPEDALVPDEKTTAERREDARKAIIPVLKVNLETTGNIHRELALLLNQIDQARESAGNFPFLDTQILSIPHQRYLRTSQEWELLILKSAVTTSEQDKSLETFSIQEEIPTSPSLVESAITQLKLYHQTFPEVDITSVLQEIDRVHQAYGQTLDTFIETPINALSQQDFIMLLNLEEESWQQTKAGINQITTQVLTQGIAAGVPNHLLQEAVTIQAEYIVPQPMHVIATQILMEVLEANLVEDKQETLRRAEQAAENLEPIFVPINKGEVIVAAGETITREDFVLLERFELSRREIDEQGLIFSTGVVTLVLIVFLMVRKRLNLSLRRRDCVLLCLLSLTTPLLSLFRIPYTNLPAIGFLVGGFYRPALAVTQVTLLTGLTAFSSVDVTEGNAVDWEYLLAGSAGGILAAILAGKMRSREELALLGGAVCLTQAGTNLVANLIISAAAETIWYTLVPGSVLFGLSGLAWSIVALGISPYLERMFDLVTPIRLAELSNPNRPLLKRLATEAPGTFQHTMFVASLAEAAAQILHCNVELVRAGTLYHDIGKMHDPMGFIENQMGKPNKHDEINDPVKSADIIKKHVSEGLVMARKYGLPKSIRDFIPEHQGTILISYFYFQAQQQAQEEGQPPIQEADFRYDGPIPQSRETGIVMLADACEAALRSLNHATPETAIVMIHKIFKARWRDGQLQDSGLTQQELPIIAEIFVRVWQQHNHQRIAYPKAALEMDKTRNLDQISVKKEPSK